MLLEGKEEKILLVEFDLEQIKKLRREWGVFRDRRPELYRVLLSIDGSPKNIKIK